MRGVACLTCAYHCTRYCLYEMLLLGDDTSNRLSFSYLSTVHFPIDFQKLMVFPSGDFDSHSSEIKHVLQLIRLGSQGREVVND